MTAPHDLAVITIERTPMIIGPCAAGHNAAAGHNIATAMVPARA
ncbi:hypothetical protein SXCC_02086 [Gluconacetobacter sp. SXCC-1]|nr:hypothetical protein SXCC_02086 [Gluconacetobacter sp. SXCC-1]